MLLFFFLYAHFQHIFHQNSITFGWFIQQDVSHRTHQLAILNDGTAAHE